MEKIMDKIEIEQIPVNPYSYIKGVHLGLLMAREIVTGEDNKNKLMAAAIEAHRNALSVKK